MTAAARGLGWPGQPGQGSAAPAGAGSDEVWSAEQSGPLADPGSQEAGVTSEWSDATAPCGPDGLGWPPAVKGAGEVGGGTDRVQAAVPREVAVGMAAAGPADVADVPDMAGMAGSAASRHPQEPANAPETRWRAPAPAVADFGAARPTSGEGGVVQPVIAQAGSDTPIARAARAALAARSGSPAWPRPGACRIITIANQKGGVGKTTTAVNLAASMSLHGLRVLVIDLDPQGNASTALDVDHHSGAVSVYNVLVDGQPLAGVVRPAAGVPQLYCAPATIDLAGAEIELVPLVARESRLVRALAGFDSSGLDYIFIDCPPSLGLLTVNALVAAPEVLIPIQCEYYALEGLEQLLRTVDLVRSHLNPSLVVSTILLTMFDGRTRLASQVADEVRDHFGEIVLHSIIPRSVRVSEAPSYGQSVMTYDPGSSGAQAYLEAAREMVHRKAPRA
jgi:chromosome partitioning protein